MNVEKEFFENFIAEPNTYKIEKLISIIKQCIFNKTHIFIGCRSTRKVFLIEERQLVFKEAGLAFFVDTSHERLVPYTDVKGLVTYNDSLWIECLPPEPSIGIHDGILGKGDSPLLTFLNPCGVKLTKYPIEDNKILDVLGDLYFETVSKEEPSSSFSIRGVRREMNEKRQTSLLPEKTAFTYDPSKPITPVVNVVVHGQMNKK